MRNFVFLLVALAAAAPAAAAAAAATPDAPATRAAQSQRPLHRRAPPLEERVALLTAELKLDAGQQADVRRILQDQRLQVMKAWSDPSVPSIYRVNATKLASERAADRIRALLNETQKTKYLAAHQPRAPGEAAGQRSVEDWMNATRAK